MVCDISDLIIAPFEVYGTTEKCGPIQGPRGLIPTRITVVLIIIPSRGDKTRGNHRAMKIEVHWGRGKNADPPGAWGFERKSVYSLELYLRDLTRILESI